MNSIQALSIENLDWNQVWRAYRQRRPKRSNEKSHWNRRAPSFARHARTSTFAKNFLRCMNLQPQWSVLDVGCGAGTLAIPLAGLVRSVTAIDFSQSMISILDDICWEQGITNVTARVLGWEDDWEQGAIVSHDVAIASRSLAVEDLEVSLRKLDSKARQRVFIASLVGDGPYDRRIFEAIGRELDRGPDYVCVYNLLNQMGILADVTFVSSDDNQIIYTDLDEAVKGFDWMLHSMTAVEELLLRDYLARNLIKKEGGWTLGYRHVARWAIISWRKEAALHPTPSDWGEN